MKKHIIAAMVGVMILAVTAPAFAAANVGGTLNFGYSYDTPSVYENASSGWGVNLNGNVSDDVSFRLGFEQDPAADDGYLPPVKTNAMPDLSEAWIQAKNTPVGTVKLGAFDMAFGESNGIYWEGFNNGDEDRPINVQIDNELAGIKLSGGMQMENVSEIAAVGASASLKPMEGLDATVGVAAERAAGWDPAVGYSATYTGIENLALGLKGNLAYDEIVGSAEYEIMPGIKVNGMYGQNYWDVDDLAVGEIKQAGVSAAFGNLHGGASYEMVTDRVENGINTGDHTVIRVNGGYDLELTKGLTLGLNAGYKVDNGNPYTTVGATAGINF
ncbi:MAG: hypothetical protein ACM3X6_04825 [Patescibacteria group bacterium]